MAKKRERRVEPIITRKRMAPKYEKQGQSKIVNSYGAVGTLIQTLNNGSLLIDQFNNWPYYTALNHQYANQVNLNYLYNNPQFIIDARLLKRLQEKVNCPTIIGLFRLPENESTNGGAGVEIPNKIISAKFFPRWFYCPGCGTLKHLSQWGINNEYPRCFNNHGPFGIRLEQFSFVLASESGKIADIPWHEFLTQNEIEIEFEFGTINAANDLVLNYTTRGSAERLETKRVIGNGISKSLGSLPSKIFIDNEDNNYQMVIRQGNNLCYVQTLSSVFIPEYEIPSEELQSLRARIRTMNEDGEEITAQRLHGLLIRRFTESATEISHIQNLLTPEDDNEFKKHEFDFMLNIQDSFIEKDLVFKKYYFTNFGLGNLYQIKKLKVTHVQTGYSRITPEADSVPIFNGKNILFYPAVEMYGEGILYQFDTNRLNYFLNQENNQVGVQQIEALVHTFSHIMMKELEFECGYPVNSLKERLYFGQKTENNVDQVDYAGVLIYTASGSNSSFGGLSSLFDNLDNRMKIDHLIEHAYIRAKDCPNDPICIDENIGGNVGTCYACTLVPEISCEKFNTALNRKLLNDFNDFLARQQAIQ